MKACHSAEAAARAGETFGKYFTGLFDYAAEDAFLNRAADQSVHPT